MGTITAQAIINTASLLLGDTGNVRWSRAELLIWLSQAQRAIALRGPGTVNSIVTMQLAVGTRQRIPLDGWILLDVSRNMGAGGLFPSAPVRIISEEILSAVVPNWHADTPTSAVTNYVYSPRDEYGFFVYPPNDGTGFVEVNYALIPAEMTAETATISMSDVFEPALVDYMCFRAHSKDAEYAAGVQLASMFGANFTAVLAAKDQAELQISPNLELAPFDPTVRGSA